MCCGKPGAAGSLSSSSDAAHFLFCLKKASGVIELHQAVANRRCRVDPEGRLARSAVENWT